MMQLFDSERFEMLTKKAYNLAEVRILKSHVHAIEDAGGRKTEYESITDGNFDLRALLEECFEEAMRKCL